MIFDLFKFIEVAIIFAFSICVLVYGFSFLKKKYIRFRYNRKYTKVKKVNFISL